MSATLYLWVRPGCRPPGYTFTGVVNRWPDTGKVRAELWERVRPATALLSLQSTLPRMFQVS